MNGESQIANRNPTPGEAGGRGWQSQIENAPPTREELLLHFLRALRRVDLDDRQRRVAEAVLEQTAGAGRAAVRIPNQECLGALCGRMTKGNVSQAVADLRSMCIIEVDADEYRFQGDTALWRSLSAARGAAAVLDAVVPLRFRIEGTREESALRAIAALNGEPVQEELWRDEFAEAMRERESAALLRANGAGETDGGAAMSRGELRERMRQSLAQFPDREPVAAMVPELGTSDASRFPNRELPAVPDSGTYSGGAGKVPESGTTPLNIKMLRALSTEPLTIKGPAVPDSGTSPFSVTSERDFIDDLKLQLGPEEMHRNGAYYRTVARNGLRLPEGEEALTPFQTRRALLGAASECKQARARVIVKNVKAFVMDRARWIGLEILKGAKKTKSLLLTIFFC